MATLRLITEQEFRTSRYAQVADQIEGRIADVIVQAETHIERTLDRTLSLATYTEVQRPQGSTLFLRNRPVQSVTTIKRRSSHTATWDTLNAAHFELHGAAGYVVALSNNVRNYEVEVTYTAGYATIPDDIKAAVILQTVILAYQDLEVYGSGDAKKPGILYLQEQVEAMLKPYMTLRMIAG